MEPLIDAIAFLASVSSLILAIVAITAAKNSEKEVRENFEKTQKVMSEYQERTKEVLAEIDKKSAVIETTVSESQRQLLDTVTNLLNETIIPKKIDLGEQFGLQLMQQLITNPDQAEGMMKALGPFMELGQQKDTTSEKSKANKQNKRR